jgi:uncharacterized protein with HEPN domain
MTLAQQRLADYLAHILEAIERIDRYTKDMDEASFWIPRWFKMP